MTTLFARAALSALIVAGLPVMAVASCVKSAGSMIQTCESGVTVYRTQPRTPPQISPAQSQSLELERQRLARIEQDRKTQLSLEQDRLKLERLRLSQTDYLYRDASSPLRQNQRRYPAGRSGLIVGQGSVGFGHVSQNGIILVPQPSTHR